MRLDWDGCDNVRDIGGLPTVGGGRLQRGVLIRADALTTLSPRGWAAVETSGVRRIVDLRYLTLPPSEPPKELEIEVVRIELYPDDPTYWERARDGFDAGDSLSDYLSWQYVNALETRGEQLTAAVAAVAGAKSGAAAVHCQAGKDRTGLVVALILRLADVPIDAVAADYALSASDGRLALERWIAEVDDAEERDRRERLSGAPESAMRQMLAELERRYGGAEAFLLGEGLPPASVAGLRARLLKAA
jgi:protein-tyrosine phosphatase